MIGRLGSLRVLSQMIAAEQIVGRERNQRACHRQLVRNAVVSRRVNSTVGHLLISMRFVTLILLLLATPLLAMTLLAAQGGSGALSTVKNIYIESVPGQP